MPTPVCQLSQHPVDEGTVRRCGGLLSERVEPERDKSFGFKRSEKFAASKKRLRTMETQNVTDIEPEMNSVEKDQIAHLAGVLDAVGAVRINVVKDSDYRLDYTLQPMLRLLRPNEDDPILGKLVAYCDEYGVRYSITKKSHGGDRDSTSIQWTVKDAESVERFLEPMMDYLVTNYFRAELMLTEVLPAIRDDKHRTKQGFYELMGIADTMREGRSLRKEPKYTQEYFGDEWSIS